jgi:hypothetical protein
LLEDRIFDKITYSGTCPSKFEGLNSAQVLVFFCAYIFLDLFSDLTSTILSMVGDVHVDSEAHMVIFINLEDQPAQSIRGTHRGSMYFIGMSVLNRHIFSVVSNMHIDSDAPMANLSVSRISHLSLS